MFYKMEKETPNERNKIESDATYITLNGVKYTVGDEVEYWIGEHLIESGKVAFGKFNAEIYDCYGFYVENNGKQISESGLTTNYTHKKVKNNGN